MDNDDVIKNGVDVNKDDLNVNDDVNDGDGDGWEGSSLGLSIQEQDIHLTQPKAIRPRSSVDETSQ